MNIATIITITSVIISTIIAVVMLWVANRAIKCAEDDCYRQIALTIKQMDEICKSMEIKIDVATNQRIQDWRSIQYLRLLVADLESQLGQKQNAEIN